MPRAAHRASMDVDRTAASSRFALAARSAAAALALATLFAATSARAWTNAAVHHVEARVVLAADASAYVTLTADVRVHGGWLEAIELAGLDPDLELDEASPPWAIDEEGERYEPRAEVHSGGRVQLSFPGRSPRRGRVSIGIAYRTSLAHRATEPVERSALQGEPRVRVHWTLPGWRSGLDGVQIEIVAPRGAQIGPRDESDGGASMKTAVREVPEGTLVSWRRAHLPRTLPWTVAVDVPASAMIPELRGAPADPSPAPRPHAVVERADATPYWLALALVLALLSCAKLAGVARLASRSRTRARPVLPLPALVRAPLALALAAGGGWLGPDRPFAALALLAGASFCAAYRRADPSAGSQLGAWRPVDVRWIRAARRARWLRFVGPSALLDATTPLGAIHLAAWASLPWTSGAPLPFVVRACAACLALPILITGTRASFPTGPADALATLLGLARGLSRLPEDVGLRPVAHVDVRGAVQDARVRTVLARRPRGLLRLDLVVTEAPRGGRYERGVALLVLTREGSAAEKALAERIPDLPGVTSPGGRRVVRVAPFDPKRAILARVVEALADCPEAPLASRGTAAPQETLRDLPAPRAVGF